MQGKTQPWGRSQRRTKEDANIKTQRRATREVETQEKHIWHKWTWCHRGRKKNPHTEHGIWNFKNKTGNLVRCGHMTNWRDRMEHKVPLLVFHVLVGLGSVLGSLGERQGTLYHGPKLWMQTRIFCMKIKRWLWIFMSVSECIIHMFVHQTCSRQTLIMKFQWNLNVARYKKQTLTGQTECKVHSKHQ